MARATRMLWQRSERYAVIDIGTNSCLLLIGAVFPSAEEYAFLYEDIVITQLGKGFYATNKLQPEAIIRTVEAVGDFWSRCEDHDVREVVVTGTSVLRDAENSDAFRSALSERVPAGLEIIPGEEEARLSYLAVRRDPDLPGASEGLCIVTDIGGGSTELILGRERIRRMASLEVGSVRVTEGFLKDDPPSAGQVGELREHLARVFEDAPAPETSGSLIGVGGTITTLANIAAHQTTPVAPVHGFVLTLGRVQDEIEMFMGMTVAERRKIPGLEPERAGVILGGALIAEHVLKHYRQSQLHTSVRGLRHGVFWDRFLDEDVDWQPIADDERH